MYGLDPVLLETRKLILEHAGFSAESAHSREKFDSYASTNAYDLWVLCHTVPEDQKVQLSRFAADRNVQILHISVMLSPEAFLDDVRRVLS